MKIADPILAVAIKANLLEPFRSNTHSLAYNGTYPGQSILVYFHEASLPSLNIEVLKAIAEKTTEVLLSKYQSQFSLLKVYSFDRSYSSDDVKAFLEEHPESLVHVPDDLDQSNQYRRIDIVTQEAPILEPLALSVE